jgi:hypothetical protein
VGTIIKDWVENAWVGTIIKKVISGVIILFHDGRRIDTIQSKRTLPMIETLLQWGTREGYSFVTVPELLNEWDNQLVSTVGDKHLLGVRSLCDWNLYTSVTPMWDTEDLLEGIRFSVQIGDQTTVGIIEPMSNVHKWISPLIVSGVGPVTVSLQ